MSPRPALAGGKVPPDSSEQLIDSLDQPWYVDLNRIPQDAMVDQIVPMDKVVSCACDILPGDIATLLFEFVREPPYALTDDLDASLQGGRRLPIRQQRIERVDGAQCTRLFGGIAYLCERNSRVTPTHESS